MTTNISIAGTLIKPGTKRVLNVPLPSLYTNTPLDMPVHVICGKKDGPRMFLSAAIHGDELNGVEIIRRILKRIRSSQISGTLIAVPVVNIYGMIQHSRYLPDRRDLNRSFPGSAKGSLASRLAYQFMQEIIQHCTHGIDLHTGALNRENLPQIRADLEHEETATLAKAFGVPVVINSKLRDGSLRESAREKNIRILLYEAGEAMRFNEISIRAGVNGVMNVMRELNMLAPSIKKQTKKVKPYIAQSSSWIRAPSSGIFRPKIKLGKQVRENEIIGFIEDPCGCLKRETVYAPEDGVVIGNSHLPLVYEGDPLFHIAYFKNVQQVAKSVETFEDKQNATS